MLDDSEDLRSAIRDQSDKSWKTEDPQLPQSMWWHTDAKHVGFRIIRPLKRPTKEETEKQFLKPVVPKQLMKKIALTQTCE